jgi:hypothetical protein
MEKIALKCLPGCGYPVPDESLVFLEYALKMNKHD